MSKNNVPKYHELMNPLLQALHNLGGSGSNDEIRDGASAIKDPFRPVT